TGHNQEGAGLVLLPPKKNPNPAEGPREILFLPPKNPVNEKWNGVRMAPTDPGIETVTGFASVKPFPEILPHIASLATSYSTFCTVIPYHYENGSYPHEKGVVDWFEQIAPQVKLKDIRLQIESQRMIKSPEEVAFLQKAIDLSIDSHIAAMKMMRPRLYEYKSDAKMTEIHATAGLDRDVYAPIVGAGPNSPSLNYDKLDRKIQDGDIVALDVGAQFSGYSADTTRTLPADGKFTPRQREIYDV